MICFHNRVLERIGYKHLIVHLRSFCELLIFEFSKSGGAGFVAKCIESINNLIWKYNIIALDRFILCMALRTTEGSEAQVSLANWKHSLIFHKWEPINALIFDDTKATHVSFQFSLAGHGAVLHSCKVADCPEHIFPLFPAKNSLVRN